MFEISVVGHLFEGVGESVAKIQYLARAGVRPARCFELVAADDLGFECDLGGDQTADLIETIGVVETLLETSHLEPVEERPQNRKRPPAAERGLLCRLAKPGGYFPPRESPEYQRIDQHASRLVKSPDEVLAVTRVGRRFAAHRRVDHGKQRRRHLQKADAAKVNRCRETRQVADDAAAERNDRVRPRKLLFAQKRQDLLERPNTFESLAVADQENVGVVPRRFETVDDRLTVKTKNFAVRDDGDAPRALPDPFRPIAGRRQGCGPDRDVVFLAFRSGLD